MQASVHTETGIKSYLQHSGKMVGSLFLNTEDNWPTDIECLQRLVVVQHSGQGNQTLRLLYQHTDADCNTSCDAYS